MSKRDDIPPNSPMPGKANLLDEKGLPQSTETERLILGSVILGGNEVFESVTLDPIDFSLNSHRRIWDSMRAVVDRGLKLDRVTLANEMMTTGVIESVGGFGYLTSLDEGLPEVQNLESYCAIVAEKSRLRQIIFAAQKTIDRALIQDASSAELAAYTTEKLLEIQAMSQLGTERERTPLQIIEGFNGGLNAFLDPSLRPKGLETGFHRLDDMTGGMHGGQLIILAARPSHGKTAMALNIAGHLTMNPRQRRPVAVFSLEMSSGALLTRMLCSAARVDMHKFRGGFLNANERLQIQQTLGVLTEAHIFINDESLTINEIATDIRRLRREHGIQLAVIDYLGLIVPSGRWENKNAEVSVITRTLKLLAKELDIPILVLCQLSRENEKRGDPRPMLSSLRDSGSIEQDADVVAFIFREELYRRDREDLRGVAELILSKQRDGPVGTIQLRYLGPYVRFENRADDFPAE